MPVLDLVTHMYMLLTLAIAPMVLKLRCQTVMLQYAVVQAFRDWKTSECRHACHRTGYSSCMDSITCQTVKKLVDMSLCYWPIVFVDLNCVIFFLSLQRKRCVIL